MKRDETIEFDFYHDSMLEIVGETKGVIQFNDFEVLSCQSTTATTTPTSTSTTWPWDTFSWNNKEPDYLLPPGAAGIGVPSKYTQKCYMRA